MTYLNPRSSSALKECTALAGLSLILILVMPLVGIAVFLFRGAVMTLVALLIAAILVAWAWHLVSPTRKRLRPASKGAAR